ncbi:hypothetical protein CRN84_06690 [Budvicia aquatica]|uniref:Uncharacterized protein n=1 Tax=Budvicia aquatica TaxID=82979 RepID=A0A2C6DJU2_9GAMM|nr:hypothetical protein CRN84_06690 [Budvicia aquatica]
MPGIDLAVQSLFFMLPVKTQVPDIGVGRKVAAGVTEAGEGRLKQGAGEQDRHKLEKVRVEENE